MLQNLLSGLQKLLYESIRLCGQEILAAGTPVWPGAGAGVAVWPGAGRILLCLPRRQV